ncbi:MAG: UvrABC system protein C [Eubacteriales bacterium SKADARSKE-1]|nr:UvrABC system protein C [Eubacteriales bacterium SKADARSKE-1]
MDAQILNLRKKAMQLPESSGVYIMKDKNEKIIYIGKAKVLKNRVSQYFGSQNNHQEKVRKMVSNVATFEYIMTDSEFEALILECSLIKQYSPKYNILLKDDKGYHYIKITNEMWPRISETKQVLDDGARYLGPYTSSSMVSKAVDEALKIFKLPSCKRNFSKEAKNVRPCLDYYIKQCSAPCIGKITHQSYMENINEAIDFLKGGNLLSIKNLTAKMNKAAENLQFEKAAVIRDKISALNKLGVSKQKVILPDKREFDVIALVQSKTLSCIEVFRFFNGKLYDSEDFMFNDVGDSKTARMEFLEQYYSRVEKVPPVILLDGETDSRGVISEWLSKKLKRKVKIIIPKKGKNLEIVEMCKNNASSKLSQKLGRTLRETSALEELAQLLSLNFIPEYIEAYDISNLYGSENVAGMVAFFNGRPLKSAYRKFKIKGFEGQDDYGSMLEVITRRLCEYEKLKNTKEGFGKLPDLILLDGGKGHVSVVKALLEEKGYNIPVFGMVKDDKHRTRAISTQGEEVVINRNRSVFTLISSIQEEVHRFAIGYHKKLRQKNTISSELNEIPGVGPKRTSVLLTYFKSMAKIKESQIDELCKVPGITKPIATNIYNNFH